MRRREEEEEEKEKKEKEKKEFCYFLSTIESVTLYLRHQYVSVTVSSPCQM